MSKQPYNPELIRDYLIGALPEEELERLDELSFTDDTFVAALNAAEKDLVDAYVQNELTNEQVVKFRSHYLSSPLRLQRAEFAAAFKTITEGKSMPSDAIGQPALRTTSAKTLDWFSVLDALASRRILRWGTIAAAMVFLAVCVGLGIQNRRLRHQIATTQSQLRDLEQHESELSKEVADQRSLISQNAIQKSEDEERLKETVTQEGNQQQRSLREPVKPRLRSIASFILTPQMRSVGTIPVVSLAPTTLNVRMNLNLEPNDYQSYKVVLVDSETNQVVWRSGKFDRQKGSGDTIGVNLRAGLLKPKTYVLRLFGTSSVRPSEFITQYPFKVVQR